MSASSQTLQVFIAAANHLRWRWLSDGHDLREPALKEFRAAREEYDRAYAALMPFTKSASVKTTEG